MNINRLETTDIFRGAYFLCMGGRLCDVRFQNSRKRIASFMFKGCDLNQFDRDYMNGDALVNPIQFRESLNRLRDILFEKLRDTQPSPRLRRAKEGRYENDRKRANRVHKGYR